MLKIYQRHLPTVGKKWYANWVFFWHSGQYTALWSTVVYLMRLEPCLNSKAFTTHIAYVRFLSSMSSHVVSQPSGACELLRTHLTLVWFVTAVSELMFHQVKWLDAGKIALITLERFFTWKKTKYQRKFYGDGPREKLRKTELDLNVKSAVYGQVAWKVFSPKTRVIWRLIRIS